MRMSCLIAALASLALAASATATSLDIRDVWKNAHGDFAKAAQPGAGFSFSYDGKPVGPVFTADWKQIIEDVSADDVSRISFAHDSGLVVTREMRVFPKFDAVEFKLRFRNLSTKILPPISLVQALNISFDNLVVDGNCLVSGGGGLSDSVLPPRNFAIHTRCFAPSTLDAASAELTTEDGRSSSKDLPFFFIDNSVKKEGLFVAFGWSGKWRAFTATHTPSPGFLTLKGRIPGIEIALEPGEEIEGPTVLVGLYAGAIETGSNRLRRLIREVYTPLLAGVKFLPVATYDTYFGLGEKFDEEMLKNVVDGAAAVSQEYFLLDAGWFGGEGKRWVENVGNWERVNTKRLPNGLKGIADHVRSKGLKFGLWFEPERVAAGTDLAKQHPEWILWKHGKNRENSPMLGPLQSLLDGGDEGALSWLNSEFGLLDYGRPEVQAWVRNMLDRYITEFDVKYIRYDFNIDPLPYWDANDGPNRRGLTQIRHIQGLYAIIDWIRTRHADVVMEGCATGGQRIDLEMARRFHTFWISDYTVDPSIVRFHLFGLNHFLPGNYAYVLYALPHSNQANFQPVDLDFQSMFGGAMGTGGHIELWPDEMKRMAQRHFGVQKALRRYLVEDYYPLSPQPADLQSWSGWQFDDPKDRSGFIQTFRTKTPNATHRFFAKGLNAREHYRFTNAYGTEEAFEITGKEAMETGIPFTQDPMTSKVLTYRKVIDKVTSR